MITYTQLARAAFDNDAQADEGHGFEDIVRLLDIDLHGVIEAGSQRALRMVLQKRGPEEARRIIDQAYAGTWSVENLDNEEKAQLVQLQAAWVDGALTVTRAMKEEQDG